MARTRYRPLPLRSPEIRLLLGHSPGKLLKGRTAGNCVRGARVRDERRRRRGSGRGGCGAVAEERSGSGRNGSGGRCGSGSLTAALGERRGSGRLNKCFRFHLKKIPDFFNNPNRGNGRTLLTFSETELSQDLEDGMCATFSQRSFSWL